MKKKETQNIEFKIKWKDEFLKVIGGFANSNGGELFIGIDDSGNVIGLNNSKKLLENLPNKIRNKLGIICNVELLKKAKKEYLKITVNSSSVPISYNGKYYIRSGTSTFELKDNEIMEFSFKKIGRTWDTLCMEKFAIKDIDKDTIQKFKQLAVDRVPDIAKENNKSILLNKLKLINNNNFTNAGILLFAKEPQRYFHNAVIKIGKFISDTDIISSDIIEGNLFQQLDSAMDILKTKYLISKISYEGIHRREILEYPYEALREAILNAIIHRSYIGSSAIQIRVYENHLLIMNEGKLPPEVPLEKLKTNHISKPGNVLLAETFYKAGLVETWGRGTLKIIEQCKEAGLPEPDFNEDTGVITVTFYKNKLASLDLSSLDLNERQIKAVEYLKENGKITNKEYQKINDISKPTATRDLSELVKLKIINKIGKRGEGTYYILIGS